MKTALVLLLAAGFAALPLNVLSLQAFVGLYTAVGVLALAVQDYRRRDRRVIRRSRARRPELETSTSDAATAWTCQTISA